MNIRPTVTTAMLLALVSSAACADRNDGADVAKPGQIALVNPGFEAPGGIDNIVGWGQFQHAGEPSFEMTVDGKAPGAGKQSFRITQTHPQVYGTIEQRVPITAEMAGKTAELSALVKTAKLGEPGWALVLNVLDIDGNHVADFSGKPVSGSTKWQRVTAAGKLPPMGKQIQITGLLMDAGNHGVAWLDDVRLRVYDAGSDAKP